MLSTAWTIASLMPSNVGIRGPARPCPIDSGCYRLSSGVFPRPQRAMARRAIEPMSLSGALGRERVAFAVFVQAAANQGVQPGGAIVVGLQRLSGRVGQVGVRIDAEGAVG